MVRSAAALYKGTMTTAPTAPTRYIGNCQICGGDFKLTPQKTMVHHGYKRPGTGWIEGDCPAVFYPPYEVSCERIKSVIVGLKAQRAGLHDLLHMVEADQLDVITLSYLANRYTGAMEHKVVKRGDPEWPAKRAEKIRQVKYEIEQLDHTIAHFERRVATWTTKPIRTIEDEEAITKKQRQERHEAAEARRKERMEKRSAINKKMADRESKKDAARAVIRDKFLAFAAAGDKNGAQRFVWELDRPKYKHLGWRDEILRALHIDEQLVALGIAKKREGWTGDPRYAYDYR